VLVDASEREHDAARAIRALARAAAGVGIVIVCEQSTSAAHRLGALPKWGWTEDLRSAVERASVEACPQLPVDDGAGTAGPLAGWSDDGPLTQPR